MYRALLVVACLGAMTAAHAEDLCQSSTPGWKELHSLKELPAEVRAFLVNEAASVGGLADEGGRFNAGDVGGNDVPRQRFVLAGINGRCLVVAIEHGGRGYYLESVEFRAQNEKWVNSSRWRSFNKPSGIPSLFQ